MKLAIVTFTANGKKISENIREKLNNSECHIYTFYRYSSGETFTFTDGKELIRNIWNRYDFIIFISACGIAVRLIAPYIEDKTKDPGIIVMDEQGKHVISLLSGHIGGANEMTEIIADIIGGQAVITTATDVRKNFSPDSFAVANNLYITDMDMAKRVAVKVLSGVKIGLYSSCRCYNIPQESFYINVSGGDEKTDTGICIDSDISLKPFKYTLNLVPRNMILGVGCRRGTDSEKFEKCIIERLEETDIPLHTVGTIASIDLKKDEKAILDFAKKYKIKFVTYSAEELNETEGEFTGSEFVKNNVGVDNVCERSAVKCGGDIVVRKTAGDGITMAVAKKHFDIDFLRRNTGLEMEE